MSNHNKVIWSEGMFLQPQHLQQNDRYVENLLRQQPANLGAFNWGISHLKIDKKQLALGKLAISECRGAFQDGTVFDCPATDMAIDPLPIKQGISNTIVYLCIPHQRSGNIEVKTTNENSNSHRYIAETYEVNDNNLGPQCTSSVQIGKLNPRLMLANEQRDGYSCIGITRIKETHANDHIILDDEFIPPCLDAYAFPILVAYIQELQGLVHQRADMLAQRFSNNKHNMSAEIADFLMLQLVNRYEPLIAHIVNKRFVHPENLYQVLLQLVGELATFTTAVRRPTKLQSYLHSDLEATFTPIMFELRKALSMVLEQSATSITLEQQNNGFWIGELNDKGLLKTSHFVLAVQASVPNESIRAYFPAQVKIAPSEDIQTLVNRALPGINIEPLATPPRQIPFHADFVYFQLNREHQYWQKLSSSAGIAFHIAGEYPDLNLELWSVKE